MGRQPEQSGPVAGRRAFFGRRKSRKPGPRQQRLHDELLPMIAIDKSESDIDLTGIFGRHAWKNFIEIGFGGGEHLARQARENPNANFIGCDPFVDGINKILTEIDSENLDNIRLFTDDVSLLMPRLPTEIFDCAFLLYPDPWPRKRHHKRRFVNQTTLDELARILKPGACFRIATDIEDYATWSLAQILRHDKFFWPLAEPGSWHRPWADWQATRYERKARQQGRTVSFYFDFMRR